MARIVRKPLERKAEIIQAARQLFQTKKYDQVTMQDVMDALNIAKGTVYHYFASKEALLEAVIENIVTTNINYMQTLINQTPGTALERIQALAIAGNISTENESLLNALHQQGNEVMHTRLLVATLIQQAKLYAQLIEQGCAEGIFTTNTPLECAELVLSGVQFLTDQGIYPWSKEDITRRMLAFPALIEQLLQAPSGSFKFMLPTRQKSKS